MKLPPISSGEIATGHCAPSAESVTKETICHVRSTRSTHGSHRAVTPASLPEIASTPSRPALKSLKKRESDCETLRDRWDARCMVTARVLFWSPDGESSGESVVG